MTGYFSDREFGSKPKVEETIGNVVWQAILSLVETRIDDGSLAYSFPSHCPDGNAIEGTERQAVSNAIRAEIGDLSDDRGNSQYGAHEWRPSPGRLPDTPAILDLVEFIARHVCQRRRESRPIGGAKSYQRRGVVSVCGGV